MMWKFHAFVAEKISPARKRGIPTTVHRSMASNLNRTAIADQAHATSAIPAGISKKRRSSCESDQDRF